MRKTISVSNITCAHCASSIESHFNNSENVSAKVLVSARKVVFEYDDETTSFDSIIDDLRMLGYHPVLTTDEQRKQKKIDLIDLVISIVFSLPLLWTMFEHLGMHFIPVPDIFLNGFFQWAMATPVLLISGRRFFKATYYQLKSKNLGMDVLVVLGTLTAYLYSIVLTFRTRRTGVLEHYYFETTAVLIMMVLIGYYFENRVKEKTSDELSSLINLGAKEARLLIDGKEQLVSVDRLNVGDVVVVLPSEKIPIDGILVNGHTYIDDSMLTGESMPSEKNIGDVVIGSSMNILNTIQIEVKAVGSDTVLSKIIKTVEETSLIKPKAQRIADKIAKYFVPVVVFLSALTFIIRYFVLNMSAAPSVDAAIAVLIISCPCALGLATPTSISVASGIAFKRQILYKGGEFFEVANQIKAIAFDKTGTLTIGEPSLFKVVGNEEAFKYTAALEKHSNHPISKAILNNYEGDFLEVKNYENLLGLGIKGEVNGKQIYVGSPNLLKQLKIDNPFNETNDLLSEGKTLFFTVIDDKVENLIAIHDPLKTDAKDTIKMLKAKGIVPHIITGDHHLTANFVAKQLGINEVIAEVLPHEKAEIINDIQNKHGLTAFVGDGINDAPALKMADVGFAMGDGADIAIDSSDVTLMDQDLSLVIDAIDLSAATLKNIYLNFFWAFIYNIVMIPLAAFGKLPPSLAGIGMGLSSITVVLNALSLKLFKFKTKGDK